MMGVAGLLRRFAIAAICSLCLAAAAGAGSTSDELWILVDTEARQLSLMQGDDIKRAYRNISIGRSGVTSAKQRMDAKTPLGEFRIARIATDSPFRRFYGFDYPTLDHAGRALAADLIDQRQYNAIRRALRAGRIPPQDTPLGGYIGIHGVGKGDPEIHESFNWTNGCIALSNRQIDDLNQWIRLGMRVIVR